MSTKDVDLQFIVAQLISEVSKRKESEVIKKLHYLTIYKVNEKVC
jgi:hypothetical protein